ncbi:hypothetical protein FPV67DRAFT_204434 [Lyophyllum atratum]|nr:hypothetical protein FPV67DRAFT_204434 [Lyophyllum atratum]
MGVAGLWDVIRPAGKTRSLTDISVTEGFEANPDGVRGYRVGIDASIWFFHAEYGKEGENPVLRTLFFRCATLMHSPFLPLFVFDGPKRPDWKRGKKIDRTSHKLIPGMKAIVESFGFEWRMAPGEAEAELAYLNRIGIIDGILSDDVDNFLFGATTVIRNASNNLSGNRANPVVNAAGKDDKNHTKVYRMSDITTHPDIRLTRGGMILIGLMSGGDYQQGGLARCGTVTSHGLAKCGFGDTLFQAANNMTREQLKTFLVAWRHELCHELRTNSQGHIGRKQPSLANSVPSEFPDIDILLSYTNPITSESMGRAENNLKLTWAKEPDLGKLAATCEFYFEWGYKEAIIKRFRTVIWHSAILRILRRAVLDLDAKGRGGELPPATPRKTGKGAREPIGTPSKMIAKYFSAIKLDDQSDSDDDQDDHRLIQKIHSERTHVSTDGILEYRLEIAPAQLVRLAESGIKGTRSAEGPDEWADEEDEEGGGKGAKKPPPDPESHMRVWMPACMVRLVEPGLVKQYEAILEKKQEKKAGKGRGKTTAKAKAAPPAGDDSASESGPDDLPIVKPVRKTAPKPKPKLKAPSKAPIADGSEDEPQVAAPKPSRIVRDLTKKKDISSATSTGLKSFFPTTKPTNNLGTKALALSSVLSKISESSQPTLPTSSLPQEEEESSSSSDIQPRKPIHRISNKEAPASPRGALTMPRTGAYSDPKGQHVVQDLIKKKPLAKGITTSARLGDSIATTKRTQSKGKKGESKAVGSSSKVKQNSRDISEEESDTSLRVNDMLVPPTKPNPLAAWNKATHDAYVSVSDSDDDKSRVRGASFHDDSHMFESDDPFDDRHIPSSRISRPKTKQVRKQKSSSSPDSSFPRRHLDKSPRKSVEHTSPRKHQPSSRNERSCSPSPVKTMICPQFHGSPLRL